MTIHTVHERLRTALAKAGARNLTEFSKKIGVVYNTVGVWGTRGKISPNGVYKLSEVTNIPAEYFETGDIEFLKIDNSLDNQKKEYEKKIEILETKVETLTSLLLEIKK